jgi:hypothetical protein
MRKSEKKDGEKVGRRKRKKMRRWEGETVRRGEK